MEKDNVFLKEHLETEREDKYSEAVAKEKDGSAVLKKFKDENALSKAYGELEAEFTRRSQRLKALEKELASLQAEKLANAENKEGDSVVGGGETAPTGVESVVEPTGDSSVGDEPMEKESNGEESKKRSLDGANVLEELAKGSFTESVAQTVSDEEIYKRASGNEEIRLKIIGDYFSSLKKSGAPLVRGGQGTIASPNSKPTSVSQAGDMALRYFKTEKTQK